MMVSAAVNTKPQKSRGMTPLQRQNLKIHRNAESLKNIREMRNLMIGLSQDTLEYFKSFIDSAWKDIGFQKSQAEVYAMSSEEDRKRVARANAAVRSASSNELQKRFKLSSFYDCTRCQDTGVTDSCVIAGIEKKVYCKCATGIKIFKKDPHLLERERKLQKKKSLTAKIEGLAEQLVEVQWKYSEDGRHAFCKFCQNGFRVPSEYYVPTHKCYLGSPEQKILDGKILKLQAQLKEINRQLNGRK